MTNGVAIPGQSLMSMNALCFVDVDLYKALNILYRHRRGNEQLAILAD